MPIVVSGFPGIGKSTAFNSGLFKCCDSDSSNFKEDFPHNYIRHIQEKMKDDSLDYILVSSHDVVRKAMHEAGINFWLVFPKLELRDLYLKRYKDRGNDPKFIATVKENWDTWIYQCWDDTAKYKTELGATEYLLQALIKGRPQSIAVQEICGSGVSFEL